MIKLQEANRIAILMLTPNPKNFIKGDYPSIIMAAWAVISNSQKARSRSVL